MSAIRFDEAARANLNRFAEQARRYAGESTTSDAPLFDLLITDRAVYAWALAVDDPPVEPPGLAPASNASIEAMARAVVTEADGVKECSICLGEMGVGGEVREMPCKHGFHSECIEKWLGIHGSCPVCRYTMPVEEEEEEKDGGSGGRRQWRRIAFTVTRIMRRDNEPHAGDPAFSRWMSSFFESGMGLQN